MNDDKELGPSDAPGDGIPYPLEIPVSVEGKVDLAWLVDQASSVVDTTVRRIWISCISATLFAFVMAGVFAALTFLPADQNNGPPSFLNPVFSILFLFIGIINFFRTHPKYGFLMIDKFQVVINWQKFFKGLRAGKGGPQKTGRLENIMMILDSMEGWLKMTYGQTAVAFMYPILGLNFAVMFSDMPSDFNITIAIFVTLFMLLGLSLTIPFLLYWKKRRFWRPRLETYRKRLGGFWEAI